MVTEKRVVSVFDSVLTRTLGLKPNNLYDDLIIVQTYFFDVIEDIILDGFMYKGEKYICFTASAGQIRTKKTVFIKESQFKKHQLSLMCGLTVDEINRRGGVNINKYLAYLALCNSATDEWKLDIRKSIVVDDMETLVNGMVDFIDDKTYTIERKVMDIPINHTDGCGMMLPSVNNKNMMVRLPWIKGLLSPFPFDKFIREHGCSGIVKDIYGKEHDILAEGIEIIFTKSQFKLYKYYDNWEHYIENFIKYNCQAGKCNEEEDKFNKAKINYQMLQTLTDITDDELKKIAKHTIDNIINISTDKKTMFKVLGVTGTNVNKNYYQQALEIYPALINDTYSKEILKQTKKSLIKEGRAGKLDIDGIFTFIIPDLYAFCQYLFEGNKNPEGLLANGEVYCRLYKDVKELDCLRSPHLYREHAVRNNVVDEEKSKWFITDGIYTSCHDLISKMLQFDVDGDRSLVCADKTLVEIAKRNMKDIVPLFYNMKKAAPTIINNRSIYEGLVTAYTGGNIGIVSNDITKIWNSENVNLDAIKIRTMENNFVIDYAKTLYKPTRPKDIAKMMSHCTKGKMPHFFIYAKDKAVSQVEKVNNSTVNKLEKIIPNKKLEFRGLHLNKFDYKMLMKNRRIKPNADIIAKYNELDLKKHFITDAFEDDIKYNSEFYVYWDIRKQLLEINPNINYVVDVLVSYLYQNKKSNYKTTLWSCFGDVIVENLKNNVKEKYTYCKLCGCLIEKTTGNRIYCKKCAKVIKREQNRIADKKYKNNKKARKHVGVATIENTGLEPPKN